MKTHTAQFKTNIKNLGREIDSIISYGNTTLHDELYSVTPHFEGGLLKSIMKQLDFESSVSVPVNTIVSYQLGLKVGNNYEYLNYGNYVVYEIEKQEDKGTYLIKCFDKMLYSMQGYEDLEITYPITVKNFLSAICTKIGLTLENTTFKNQSREITKELYLDLGYTYRDVLDEIAQVAGANIIINSSDKVEVKYFTDTNDTINESYLKDANINFAETYGPINSIVLSRAAESDSVYLRDEQSVTQNGLCEIKIKENQIMNWNDRSDYLPELLQALDGLTFSINDFNSTGICYYDPCDIYHISIDNTTYDCIMLNDEINVTSGLEEIIHTDLPEESETDYSKADKTDRRINAAYAIVDKQNQRIDLAVTTANEASSKVSTLEVTVGEISETVSEHTEEIQQVQDQTQTNTDEIASLGSTSTEEGQILTINSSNNPATIEVWGNTEQDENPSPSSPKEIINVGHHKNLFDKSNANLLDAYINSTNKKVLSSANAKTLYISVKPNTSYTVSKTSSARFAVASYVNTPANNEVGTNAVQNNTATTLTLTTGSNDAYLAVFYYISTADTLTEEEIRNSIKVEEGSIATPYTAYGKGTINLLIQNKNLFRGYNYTRTTQTVTFKINENGSIKVNGTATSSAYSITRDVAYTNNYGINLKAGTYKLSGGMSGSVMVQVLDIITGNKYAENGGSSSSTFTLTNDAVVYLRVYVATGTTINNIVYPMIEEGETETSYEPHQEQIIQFSLPQDFELCKIGTYQDYIYKSEDKWYKHKEINKKVFDGSESWNITQHNSVLYFTGIEDYAISNNIPYSNYYKGISNVSSSSSMSSQNENSIAFINNHTNYRLFIKTTAYTSARDFETWLSTHNMILYYLLETPIEEEIIDEDMLTALNNIYTYKGITHIWCIDEIIPSKIKVTYYPNTPFNDTLVTKDTFEKVTNDLSASINIKANEVETSVKEETTSTILTLLNNGYLTAEQVNALVNGNAEDIATIKQQLTQTITNSQMQIAITNALEGGVSYLKNTLFTIDENGMAIATSQDEFNALYNNKGMYLYSFQQMIAKFDVDGATITGTLTVTGDLITPCTKKSKITVNGVVHEYTHWIGG